MCRTGSGLANTIFCKESTVVLEVGTHLNLQFLCIDYWFLRMTRGTCRHLLCDQCCLQLPLWPDLLSSSVAHIAAAIGLHFWVS